MALLATRLASHRAPRLAVQVQISTDSHPQWQSVLDAWKFDVAVLDCQLVLESPDLLGRTGTLRQQNPGLCIFAYFSFADLDRDPSAQETIHTGYTNAVRAITGGVTRDTTGNPIILWTAEDEIHDLANVMSSSAVRDLAVETIQSEIMVGHKFDGMLLDWAAGQDSPYTDITWLEGYYSNGQFDLDGNGVADSDSSVNAAWVTGLRDIYTQLDAAGVFLLGNAGSITAGKYNDLLNGVLCETFSEDLDSAFSTWAKRMRMFVQYDSPCLLMVRTDGNTTDEQRQRRFGLASACLLDGVYFCGTNKTVPDYAYVTSEIHDGYYVDDEGNATDNPDYRHWLGLALLPATCPADNAVLATVLGGASWADANSKVWWRPFARGGVAVNPTTSSQTVTIPAGYRRLSGEEDATFDGASVSGSVTIPARDALILFRTDVESLVQEVPVGYQYELKMQVLFGEDGDQYFAHWTKRNLDGDPSSGTDDEIVAVTGSPQIQVQSSDGQLAFLESMVDTGDENKVWDYTATGDNKTTPGQQVLVTVSATVDGASRVRRRFFANQLRSGYALGPGGLDEVAVFGLTVPESLERITSAVSCVSTVDGNQITFRNPDDSADVFTVTMGGVRGQRTDLEIP